MCLGQLPGTGWRSVTGCRIFIGRFSQKSPMIAGSFAKNDMQLKASYGSWPPCTSYFALYIYTHIYVCACVYIYVYTLSLTTSSSGI